MRWQVGGDTTTVTYEYAYRCHGCSALVPQGQINWPDVCDQCYWCANLSANLAAAGMAAAMMGAPCDCYEERDIFIECYVHIAHRTMREAVS